jgi:hypothetical protein
VPGGRHPGGGRGAGGTGGFQREFVVGPGVHSFHLNAFKSGTSGNAALMHRSLAATFYPAPLP